MDNITHSLIGLGVGEVLHRATRRRLPRPLVLAASVLGNNFPDLDVVERFFFDHKLSSLLHHRGHTHTLVAALPLAIAITALLWWYMRLRGKALALQDWLALWGVAGIGCCLHIFADSWNSYGVHPFWPFDNHWYYGDSVFIVEPWLWALLVPPLFGLAESRQAKIFYGAVVVLLFGLLVFTKFVPWVLVGALALVVAGGFLCARKQAGRTLLGALSAVALLLLGMKMISREAHTGIRRLLADPKVETLDIALSPFPANPFCWNFITVDVEAGKDSYRMDTGTYAPFVNVFPAADCPRFRESESTAPLWALAPVHGDAIVWRGRFEAKLSDYRNIAHSCWFRAFLRFSRMPFVTRQGEAIVVGDLRFDREKSFGFSEFVLPETGCPTHIPSWVEPRRDLLEKII